MVVTPRGRMTAATRKRRSVAKRSQRIIERVEMPGETIEDLQKACNAIVNAVNVVGSVNMFPHRSFAKATLFDIFDLTIRDLDRARFRLGKLIADLRAAKPRVAPRRVPVKR